MNNEKFKHTRNFFFRLTSHIDDKRTLQSLIIRNKVLLKYYNKSEYMDIITFRLPLAKSKRLSTIICEYLKRLGYPVKKVSNHFERLTI